MSLLLMSFFYLTLVTINFKAHLQESSAEKWYIYFWSLS